MLMNEYLSSKSLSTKYWSCHKTYMSQTVIWHLCENSSDGGIVRFDACWASRNQDTEDVAFALPSEGSWVTGGLSQLLSQHKAHYLRVFGTTAFGGHRRTSWCNNQPASVLSKVRMISHDVWRVFAFSNSQLPLVRKGNNLLEFICERVKTMETCHDKRGIQGLLREEEGILLPLLCLRNKWAGSQAIVEDIRVGRRFQFCMGFLQI